MSLPSKKIVILVIFLIIVILTYTHHVINHVTTGYIFIHNLEPKALSNKITQFKKVHDKPDAWLRTNYDSEHCVSDKHMANAQFSKMELLEIKQSPDCWHIPVSQTLRPLNRCSLRSSSHIACFSAFCAAYYLSFCSFHATSLLKRSSHSARPLLVAYYIRPSRSILRPSFQWGH